MNLKRKIQKAKKKKAEKELKDKVMSFDRMPDCCVMCYKDFDKKSREMANTWIIVERREERRVSLFCPDCWNDGVAAVEEQLVRKRSEVEKHFDKQNTDEVMEKAHPDPRKYPEVDDYVQKAVPKAEDGGNRGGTGE